VSAEPRVPGDVASATVLVSVPPDVAFDVFVNEIDLWWFMQRLRTGPADAR